MHEISIKAEEIFHIGSFPVTNALLLAVITVLLLVVFAYFLKRSLKPVPGKMQSMVEVVLDGMLSLMDSVLGRRELSVKYLPVVATIFIFILVSNWLGLFPFIGPIVIESATDAGHGEHSVVALFRAPASDLNFTIALAIIAVLGINVFGATAIGLFRYLSKFFTLKNPIFTFAGILEFIAEFVKIVSFSFRLFGNVFAGEVLLIIIGFLVPYFAPLPFLALEVFVGFIQAFIFAMLTLVFIAMAVVEEPAH